MVDKLIATIHIRDDDDGIASTLEVVETDAKLTPPVRVREFPSGAPNHFYKTWLFDDRVAAMSHALTIAGFGPLADNEAE